MPAVDASLDPAEAVPPVSTPSSTRAFLVSVSAKIFVVGLYAATGIVSARALQPAGRGELNAIILWYTFLASAFTFGIPSAVTFQLRKNPAQRSQIFSAAIILALCASAVAMIAGYFGLPHLLRQYDPRVIFFARLFLWNTPVATLFLVGRAALESDNDFAGSNLSFAGPPFLTVCILVAFWVGHRLDPITAAWSYVSAGIPFFLYLCVQLRRRFVIRFQHFRQNVQLLLSYGIRSYGIDLCGTMALYVDQALVVRMLQPKMFGIYVVALSLSRMLNVFHTAVVMVLFPKAVSAAEDQVLEMTGRAARLTTLMTTSAGIVVALFGPVLLSLLYGSEYRGAANILRILVLEVIVSGATLVLSQAFMALARPGVVTFLHVIGLALTVPLMLLLVPRQGTTGAAIALLLSTCARFLFISVSFSLFLKKKRPSILPRLSDLHYLRNTLMARFRPKSAVVSA